jgi:hypothetical protein
MAAAAAAVQGWAELQHSLQEVDTFKPENMRNRVDVRLLFDTRERPEVWAEFEAAAFANMQGLQSKASELIPAETDKGMSYSLSIDIDPRTGGRFGDQRAASRWVLEFRDVAVLTTKAGTAGNQTQMWEPEGFLNSVHNLKLLLDHAQVLPDVLALAADWKRKHKLMVGFVNPTISMTETVSRVTWVDNELRWFVEEHRNLPVTAVSRMMRSRPHGVARCGQFLRLTFVDTPRLGTTYMKVNGQAIESVFPTPLPEFDLSEIPA